MTDPSVGVSRPTLVTHCRAVATSVRETASADPLRSVTDRITGVRMPAAGELVERTPTVRR